MPEKLEKLHIYICICAALVVTGISIAKQVSLYRMSIWVSVTIVVFYGLGQMVRLFLTNWVFQQIEEATITDTEEQPAEESEEPAETEPVESEDDFSYADAYDTDDD